MFGHPARADIHSDLLRLASHGMLSKSNGKSEMKERNILIIGIYLMVAEIE